MRAAVSVNQPPLALILEDPSREWTVWDYRLVKALVIYEEYQTGTGVPMYWDRSDKVRFEVGSYTSRSKAALDRAEEKARNGKAKNYGKIYYPIPVALDGGMLPSLQDFLEEQELKRQMSAGNIRIGDKFNNSNWEPSTKDDLLS